MLELGQRLHNWDYCGVCWGTRLPQRTAGLPAPTTRARHAWRPKLHTAKASNLRAGRPAGCRHVCGCWQRNVNHAALPTPCTQMALHLS